jgi:hypothetical protein
MRQWPTVLALIYVALCTSTAGAAERRAVDDASLRAALRDAEAGDVVRVAPGTYRGGVLASPAGEPGRPVVIEGDERDPPLIEGGTTGLQLADARHVTLRNLRFRGATGNGLNIDDGGDMDASAAGIVIERVHVSDVGPRGNHDGIKLSGVRDFVIRDSTVEGWGGGAIDMVGCHDGVIERCTFRGKDGFQQSTGPQLKGGTSRVTIRDCRFDRAGSRAINCGGSTGLPYFRPLDATYEAKDITIERNTFRGGETPVAFVGVDGAVFRQNVIYRPEKWVLRILQESTDKRFVPCRDVRFEDNLIVYTRQAVQTVANVGPNTRADTFTFDRNRWFCIDAPDARPQLPVKETNARYGEDPKLKLDAAGFPVDDPIAPRSK